LASLRSTNFKRYTTLYDESKGIVSGIFDGSFHSGLAIIDGVHSVADRVDGLVGKGLRASGSHRYGSRSEVTLEDFVGTADELLLKVSGDG
jgi:hypothetical protein